MSALSSVSDSELLELLASAVRAERASSAEVIAHLGEVEERQLHLGQACPSLYKYCIDRLGYSEDGALKRVRVARLARRLPRVLNELRSGAIHLTGLFVLSQHLTEENAEALLEQSRGKSKREIEKLIAECFPRPDVATTLTPLPATAATGALSATCSGPGAPSPRPRVEPPSAKSYRLELTISAALHEKIEQLRNLLSHALPSRDIALVTERAALSERSECEGPEGRRPRSWIERAIDRLLEVETRRRMGAGKPRKRRARKPGSRHVPVDVGRKVRERDGEQCAFVDETGRRCSERAFLTYEHQTPYARGGPSTEDNLTRFCKAHNEYAARQVFGKDHVKKKTVFQRVLSALVHSGFKKKEAEGTLRVLETQDIELREEPLLRAALITLAR